MIQRSRAPSRQRMERERQARPVPFRPRASVRPYDRRTELPRILPLWPYELDDETPEGRRRIVCKLRRALRAERRRGVSGHWTYDLARHAELLRIYRLELASSGPQDVKIENVAGKVAQR